MMTRTECAAWLLQQDNYCILTHGAPDGDTLGSAAGLCLGLRAAGKTAYVLENPEIGPRLDFLCRDLQIGEPMENATIISVDIAAPNMIQETHRQYTDRVALRIDHHGSATSFTPLELVDPTAAACAEIIYDVLAEMGVAMTQQIAIALYTGTATDTGCFRFSNTNTHTFLVVAGCSATGANFQPINQALFDTVSLSHLRVQAWVTENTKFYADGQVAVCALPYSLTSSLNVAEEEIGGMAGFVRSIEGVKMAATLRESGEGRIYISLRAVPGYNCAAVAEKFGGGGHKGAAGGGSSLPLGEITEALTEEMLKQF